MQAFWSTTDEKLQHTGEKSMLHLLECSCRQFGRPREGISIGPIKFSQFAELVNARAAMVGYALLMYIGYNTVRFCCSLCSVGGFGTWQGS